LNRKPDLLPEHHFYGKKVVIGTHGFSESHFKVGSYHLAKWWARGGADVLSVTMPVSLLHIGAYFKQRSPEPWAKLKKTARGIYPTRDGYKEFVPFVAIPFKDVPFLKYFQQQDKLLLNSFTKELRRHKFDSVDYLFIENPSFLWLAAVVPHRKLIYRITDIYAAMGHSGSLFYSLEQELIRKADSIIATSIGISSFVQQQYTLTKPVHIVNNGVDLENFISHTCVSEQYHKPQYAYNLVYVGALDFRIDFEFIAQAAAHVPEAAFHLFGPDHLRKPHYPANVYLHGPVSYHALGSVLPQFDIGLLPFKNHPANNGRSPMKLYEYGICGLPTLARKTLDLAAKEEINASLFLYDSVASFTTLLKTIMANKEHLSGIAREVARTEAWSEKSMQIAAIAAQEAIVCP
jgi:hypothetical protein